MELSAKSILLLIEFFQIHTAVKLCDLITVTIEHKRLAAKKLADAALSGLGPTWMIDLRINVGVKAVLLRLHHIPRCWWLFLDEADLDNGFDAFGTVIPRHHDGDRGAGLGRQNLAIQTD